ncbi:DNA-directed RNA polymerase subunit delta [Alicyclobacillus sp. ALC3]|uniref:DNA-directed RNA polymerase subunit delta n=1 Tax=Alicyclobacillus sp. ALC3 TaxID=2796143 RepID=UPI002378B074|nr:DNA-directed RNA polymerase subunit delta [Alicyclobacillus sp. ALC3]WDL95174.1 DNA-directed RNA polymerase subunit delta [Alicyclobacillus sp. ALC3]
MAATLTKSNDEIREMPLVELAYEILKAHKEPEYFRDLTRRIQELRGMTEAEMMDVMARLYTEINMDGRFICIGQNVWGLKRWYPVDKVADKPSTSKRFVRRSGDAFSDDEEDLDADYDDSDDDDEEEELLPLDVVDDDADDEDEEADLAADEEDEDFEEDEEELADDAELETEEEEDLSDDEDEEY